MSDPTQDTINQDLTNCLSEITRHPTASGYDKPLEDLLSTIQMRLGAKAGGASPVPIEVIAVRTFWENLELPIHLQDELLVNGLQFHEVVGRWPTDRRELLDFTRHMSVVATNLLRVRWPNLLTAAAVSFENENKEIRENNNE